MLVSPLGGHIGSQHLRTRAADLGEGMRILLTNNCTLLSTAKDFYHVYIPSKTAKMGPFGQFSCRYNLCLKYDFNPELPA